MAKTKVLNLQNDVVMTDKLDGPSGCMSVQNFDTAQGDLYPRPSTILDTGGATQRILNFTPGLFVGNAAVLWALGREPAPGVLNTIYFNNSPASDTVVWMSPANNTALSGTLTRNHAFKWFKGYLYGWISTGIWRFGDTTATPSWSLNWQSIANTNVAQSVHHTGLDRLYLFSDYRVHVISKTGVFTQDALVLDTSHFVAHATQYGRFLAVAMQALDGISSNYVAIWDCNTDVDTQILETIDCGTGNIQGIATLNGRLIVASTEYINSDYGLRRGRFVVRGLDNSTFIEVNAFTADATSSVSSVTSYDDGTHLYVNGLCPRQGSNYRGIWRIDASGAVQIEYSDGYQFYTNFTRVGNVWYISDANVVAPVVRKTTDQASSFGYSNPSIYETRFFDEGDVTVTKRLRGISVGVQSLPSGASVSLYYRFPEQTAWTLIKTENTLASTRLSAIGLASGGPFPEYKQIQFRVESTGKAIIKDMRYSFDVITDEQYT